MGEKELIERIRDREEQGAEDLLRHYGPLMRYIIEPILANPQDREECLSEAAMRVWDGIGGYDPGPGQLDCLAHCRHPQHRPKPPAEAPAVGRRSYPSTRPHLSRPLRRPCWSRSGGRSCGRPSPGCPRRSCGSFTGNTTICSPRSRLPPSWA